MFKRLFTVLAFCAVLTGQQMTTTGGSTSTGGALLSAPFGATHTANPADTDIIADIVNASKHVFANTITDSITDSPTVSVHKIVIIRPNDSLAANPVLDIHRKSLLALADTATLTDAPVVTHKAIYRPTTYVDSGVNQDDVPVICQNDPFAYDGNLSTQVTCIADLNNLNGRFTIKDVTWFGFPSSAGGFSSYVLNVDSSGTHGNTCTTPINGMSYSINNGGSYTAIATQQGDYSNTAQISLPVTQDLTKVRIATHAECATATGSHSTATETVFEIWIQAQ